MSDNFKLPLPEPLHSIGIKWIKYAQETHDTNDIAFALWSALHEASAQLIAQPVAAQPAALFTRHNKGGSGEFIGVRWNMPYADTLNLPDEGALFFAPPAQPESKDAVKLGEKLFSFSSMQDWAKSSSDKFSALGVPSSQIICIDRLGRICGWGAHFEQAEKDGAYPIHAYSIRTAIATYIAASIQAKVGE